ncbi:MAG: hypothetical protein AAFY54_15390 [Cyanobacteria bacterium J06648_10]
MKPSHHADPQSAPTHYAPSVPMSVYRELAAELRANKAVIDSLNSRNQQLLDQNQRLKKEIHNVVQATLSLGQYAGVARPAPQDDYAQAFPSAIAPDTLAKLVRAQGEARKVIDNEPAASPEQFAGDAYAPEYAELYRQQDAQLYRQQDHHAQAEQVREQQARAQAKAAQAEQAKQQARAQAKAQARADKAARAAQAKAAKGEQARAQAQAQAAQAHTPAAARNRVPRPIQTAPAQIKSPDRAPAPRKQKVKAGSTLRQPNQRADMLPTGKPLPKLFTEQAGEYRTSALESQEDKEIGGIWLALSIILIIVTAFGAGFLIMKPLLNDR